MAESVYRITELVGTSTESWEKAASVAVETASQSLRDLRIAEIAELDLQLEDGRVRGRQLAGAARRRFASCNDPTPPLALVRVGGSATECPASSAPHGGQQLTKYLPHRAPGLAAARAILCSARVLRGSAQRRPEPSRPPRWGR